MKYLIPFVLLALSSCSFLNFQRGSETTPVVSQPHDSYEWVSYSYENLWPVAAAAADFDVSQYIPFAGPYGVLYVKMSPMKQAVASDDSSIQFEYRDGVEPDLKWYDLSSHSFKPIAQPELELGDGRFERIERVHFSSSEPKLLFEIGYFDMLVPNIEESFGIGEIPPVRTRGLVYDLSTDTFSDSADFSSFSSPLNLEATITGGVGYYFAWDSANQRVGLAPGGEGCGSYSSLIFVDSKLNKVLERGDTGTDEDPDFADEVCNPRNGVTPDNRWMYLVGLNNEGAYTFKLFGLDGELVKTKTWSPGSTSDSIDLTAFDVTGDYPVFQINGSEVIDFNQ